MRTSTQLATPLAALCAALLLTACAGPGGGRYGGRDYEPQRPAIVTPTPGAQQVHPLARSAVYTCEDLTTVTITEGQPDARAMLNSGLELGLARLGANRWGAQPYEFRANGPEGAWINQGKLNRCRVK